MARFQKVNNFQPGDVVGISLPRYNRQTGELTGSSVVTRGTVMRVYKPTPKAYLRAEVQPENKTKWFLYTGKTDWAYISELTLVKREGFDHGRQPGRFM